MASGAALSWSELCERRLGPASESNLEHRQAERRERKREEGMGSSPQSSRNGIHNLSAGVGREEERAVDGERDGGKKREMEREVVGIGERCVCL